MRSQHPKGKRAIAPPDLPSHLEMPLFPVSALTSDGHFSEVALCDWDVSGQSADNLLFDAVSFERANLSETVLRRLRLRDVRLLKSDLSNATWPAAAFDRVELHAGRLTGLKAVEATFSDVRFVGCKADLAQFRHAAFRDVRFEDCNLRDADFHGADLRGVSFRGCDMQGANLTAAKLEKADFRGARLEHLTLRPADLKGLIIDSGQAMELSGYLAQLLGMTVVDG